MAGKAPLGYGDKQWLIEILLRRQFPFSWAPTPIQPLRPHGNGRGADSGADERHRARMEQLAQERKRLWLLPEADLLAMQANALAEDKAKREAELAKLETVFHAPENLADFEFWTKAEYWTFDEAVALLLGKEPKKLPLLLAGSQMNETPFAQRYGKLSVLAKRAGAMQGPRLRPRQVVAWAEATRAVEVPTELRALPDSSSTQQALGINAQPERVTAPDEQARADRQDAQWQASRLPNWDVWAHMPTVELWQAVALSMPMEPEAVKWDRNGWMAGGSDVLTIDDTATFGNREDAARFRSRYTLLQACYWHSPFTRPIGASPLHRSPVKLLEFARWASTQPLYQPLPERLFALSTAPEATPIRAEGSRQDGVSWDKWRLIPRAPLWKAACLSCGEEPRESMLAHMRQRGGSLIPRMRLLGERLEVLQANVTLNGPIRPQGTLYRGILDDPKCEVLLSEVASFLTENGVDIPSQFAALTSAKPAEKQDDRTEDEVRSSGTNPTPESDSPATRPIRTGWSLEKPDRMDALTRAIYDTLRTEHAAGHRRPSASQLLALWREKRPLCVVRFMADGVDWTEGQDEREDTATKKDLSDRIYRMTRPPPR